MGIAKKEYNCMLETTNEETMQALNDMVEDWRTLFDIPPPMPLTFSINKQDMLCMNGIMICHIDDVNIQDLTFEPETLYIGSNSRGHYRIMLIWDYRNQMDVREVSLVLFSC
jgi:hypothetical protein